MPRRRTSVSEEHSAGNISRAASADRSLLSQQIRMNSDTSLSQMSNGTAAHVFKGSPEAAEAQVGRSSQSFPPLPQPKQESGSDEGSHLSNGGCTQTDGAVQNGTLPEGFGENPSTESQSQEKRAPSIDWQPHALPDTRKQHQGQVQVSPLPMCLVTSTRTDVSPHKQKETSLTCLGLSCGMLSDSTAQFGLLCRLQGSLMMCSENTQK